MINIPGIEDFLDGGTFVANCGIALVFLRHWWRSRDALFQYFGAAFVVLALERLLLFSNLSLGEYAPVIYLARLVAFGLIIVAIIRKNLEVNPSLEKH
jgi:hypothetical protein